MSTKHIVIIVAVLAAGVATYFLIIRKKAVTVTNPPAFTTKQTSQQTLTGALNSGVKQIATAAANRGIDAATDWLKDVNW